MAVVEEAPKKSGFFSSIGGFLKKAVSAVKAKATSWWEILKQVVSNKKDAVKDVYNNPAKKEAVIDKVATGVGIAINVFSSIVLVMVCAGSVILAFA